MTNILHIINGEYYAGAERVQDLLGLYLHRHGYQPSFACLKQGKYAEKRQSENAPLFSFPMRYRGDLSPVFSLASIVRRMDCRLIHTHTPRTALIGLLAATLVKRPMVHQIHGPTAPYAERIFWNFVTTTLERVATNRAARLISVSESIARHLRQAGYQSEKIRVVYNGVPSHLPLRTKIPPNGTWTIGTMALFRPLKGLEVLLHALQKLRERGVTAHLRAVGPFETTTYEQALKRLSANLQIQNQVTWTGFTEDVESEFQKMDVFVLPSLCEGLPMVILEAMAAGVPVVATRIQGIPEIIEHGVTGLLAAPGDPVSLADALQSIISGKFDWSAIRQAASALQAGNFSAENMAAGISEVYDEILTQ